MDRFLYNKAMRTAIAVASVLLCAAIPVLAQEEGPAGGAFSPAGTIFRWVNFALIAGAVMYVVRKFGIPAFRGRARAIAQGIREAAEMRSAGERELADAKRQMAALAADVEELRRAAVQDSAAEAERIRALTQREAEKIGKAAAGEMAAAERAGRQELRAIAARLATERAAALLAQRVDAATQADLFRSFVGQLHRSAS
jgi:F-type H+-transporting ATPase subunit b